MFKGRVSVSMNLKKNHRLYRTGSIHISFEGLMNLLWLGMVFDSTVSITHCSIVCAQQMLNEPISEFLLCVGEGDNYPF